MKDTPEHRQVDECGGEQQQAVDEGRRRVLRASAAAPLVASLTPNPVAAMASVSCDQKPDSQLTDARSAFAGDGVMGVRAELYEDHTRQQFYGVGNKVYDKDGKRIKALPPSARRIDTVRGNARFAAGADKLEAVEFTAKAESSSGLTPSCDASIHPGGAAQRTLS